MTPVRFVRSAAHLVWRSIRPTLAIVFILAALWFGGLVWFAATIDQEVGDGEAATDAIVVLTGGSQRLEAGFHLLVEGKAKKLFISGVHQELRMADLLRLSPQTPHWVECCVVLGREAESTLGNAAETAQWLADEQFRSIRLVTANYHMRRSLLEFRRALPADMTIVPNPVFPEATRQGPWWLSRSGANVIVGEYLKYLGALVRPFLFPNPASTNP